MPFVTRQTDVRVINSKIGKVIPIVDIARAIDYKASNLREMVERNAELFDGTVCTVELAARHETAETSHPVIGSEVQMKTITQMRSMRALNHYGVVGLLMKLDYHRIQDEEKKAAVLRFQRWAMEVLGNGIKQAKSRKSTYRIIRRPVVPDGAEGMTVEETAAYLMCSVKTVYRYINKGLIPAYRANRSDTCQFIILQSDLDTLTKEEI
jgi:excisionase family DNA binding protein